MTGAGGAGGSHGRRHRAGVPSGIGRSGDHRVGRTDTGARTPDHGIGTTDDGAPAADAGAAGVEGGAPRGADHPGETDREAGSAGDRLGEVDRPGEVDGRAGSRSVGPTNDTDHPVRAFFRANPQVFVLLVICLVLGLGTFIVVLLGLVTAGSDQTTGEPSGAILGVPLLAALISW